MDDILIISNYYPPEKGAAANRIGQLAVKLKEYGYNVSVLCPLANYPEGRVFAAHRGRFSVRENIDGISVSRLWIYPSVSKNLFKRLLSVSSFAIVLALHLIFSKTPHKIIVQSPPLLLSFICVSILSFKRKKIILNVSDLWPLAAIELNALKRGSFSHGVSLVMERSLYKSANVILGQSNEILTHIQEIVPGKRRFLYRNYPDHQDDFTASTETSGPVKLFYAGLLGVAQGVLELCREIRTEGLNAAFHIFGDGAEKAAIENYIKSHPEKQIHFHGMLGRRELHEMLESFDVALVPLAARIYGSVPSKIFEYAALGIPVLYFGGGEGEQIVQEHHLGWTAAPGDFSLLNALIKEISEKGKVGLSPMRRMVWETSQQHFNLDRQLQALIRDGVF